MPHRQLLHLGFLALIPVFFLSTSKAVKVDNVLTESDTYQTLEPTGEVMFEMDGDEIFHVDLAAKRTEWRLPQFGKVASFEAALALQIMAVMKHNIEVVKEWANNTKATYVAPDLHVFTKEPVVLGEPCMLICLATKFFPPVIKMSWLKNNQPVTLGVTETDFYPAPDGSFSKFLYLAEIPKQGDVYTCSVEHGGLPINPTNKFWSPEVPRHVSETSANVVCGLGLVFGICGIIAGIVLICKARNMNQGRGH
ncbi:mamu class II histocompatibility antigen, DR alpha chain-like [Pseudophryne corroboree]|uniref:mamu class II histocompatibility antigen, DR alpha chain-like n=1 Tax=Pseudophryne corroboree TaxID=495146 RepID=UPI003081FBCF